jgi:hypothetical protein
MDTASFSVLPSRVLLGNRISGNDYSRKPSFLYTGFSETSFHTPASYTVPGRRQSGLFIELPSRLILGNSRPQMRSLHVMLGGSIGGAMVEP